MAWFRVDDGWHKHRKRLRAGIDLEGMAAQGLWVAAGSWAGDELTDGWVPAYVVDYLAPGIGRRLAGRLVAAGLWIPATRDGEDGWEFHQWVEQQRTREQVLAERKASAERQASWRERANARRAAEAAKALTSENSPATSRVSNAVTNGPVTPTRPDPTRPVVPTELQKTDDASSASPPDAQPVQPKSRGTRIPESFKATPEMIAWARKNTPNVGLAETEAFIDHFRSVSDSRGIKRNWEATWRNWMRREQKRIDEVNARRNGRHYSPASGTPNAVAPVPLDDRCPKHQGQRKDKCGPCRADAIAARRTA